MCAKLRKKYIDVEFGPVPEEQIMIAPAFYTAQVDTFGPFKAYNYAFPANTRSTKDFKIWFVAYCCPVTSSVNMQVALASSADEFTEATTRFFCECGVPSLLFIDRDTALMKMVENVEFFIQNVQGKLTCQFKMPTKLCPVSGHNFHGRVERIGRTFQDTLVRTGLDKIKMDPLLYQTLCKLFENMYNSQPIAI